MAKTPSSRWVAAVATAALGYTASVSFGNAASAVAVRVIRQSSETPPASTEDRAAAFAARAVADVGLADSTGYFFDYLRSTPIESSWQAIFEGGCFEKTCEAARLLVTVDELGDSFRTTDVDGPVSERERAELLAYHEQSGA